MQGTKKKITFIEGGAVGGNPDTMSEEFKRVHKISQLKDAVVVDCLPLAPLINQRFTKINFFSLDVEGYEYNFLDSIDFEAVQIDVIITETSSDATKNSLIVQYLKIKGYTCYTSLIPRSYLFIHHSVKYCYRLIASKNLNDLLKNF